MNGSKACHFDGHRNAIKVSVDRLNELHFLFISTYKLWHNKYFNQKTYKLR